VPLFYKKRGSNKRQAIDISAGEWKRKRLGSAKNEAQSEQNSQKEKEEDMFKI
jgi:hypothetical protein